MFGGVCLFLIDVKRTALFRTQAFDRVSGGGFEGQDADGEECDEGGEQTGGCEDPPL